MYKENIDEKELSETLVNKVMYSSLIKKDEKNNSVTINLQGGEHDE